MEGTFGSGKGEEGLKGFRSGLIRCFRSGLSPGCRGSVERKTYQLEAACSPSRVKVRDEACARILVRPIPMKIITYL